MCVCYTGFTHSQVLERRKKTINSLNRLIIRTFKEEILLVVIHVGVKTGIKRKTCHDKGTGTNIYI